jgi:transcriptional repressor NrdR
MKCIRCGGRDSSVIDSRAESESIRRRRECQTCALRFTTYERIEYSLPLVVKKDGSRQVYDRGKIKGGILRACEKRPINIAIVESTIDKIEQQLHEIHAKEITSLELGRLVMNALQEVDQIAYVRFASVYREFSDVQQFIDTLRPFFNKDSA